MDHNVYPFLSCIRFVIVTVSLLSTIFTSAFAQHDNDLWLNPKEMQEDVDSLKSYLLHTHTDLYRFVSEAELQASFRKLDSSIQQSLPRWKFYLAVNEVLTKVKDIHTRVWLPTKLDDYAQYGGHYLPFSIKLLSGRLFMLEDGESSIPIGSELVSINGIMAHKIIHRLKELQYTDGYVEHITAKMLEINFRRHLPWVVNIYPNNTIQYIPYGTNDTVSIAYLSCKWRDWAPQKSTHLTSRNLNYFFHILSNQQTAYLRISSFSKGNQRQYNRFLKKSFKDLAKSNIQDLIIDLRDNRGGYVDRGAELVSYLADEPFLYVSHSIVKSSRLLSQKVVSQANWYKFPLKPFKKSFDKELFGCSRKLPGTYDTLYWEPQNVKNEKLHFDGNLYLLVDGLSMSNAALIHHALDRLDLAVSIGEPSGCTGNSTFGHAARFILPRSRLHGSISTLRIHSIRGEFNIDPYALKPDYFVPNTLEDILRGHDTQLKFALSLIQSSPLSLSSP